MTITRHEGVGKISGQREGSENESRHGRDVNGMQNKSGHRKGNQVT